MSFDASADTPTSPPTPGGKIVGMGAGPTYSPDTFNVDDFAKARLSTSTALLVQANEAIRNESAVTTTIYFDVSSGGASHGAFDFRSSSSFATLFYIDGVNGHVRPGADNAQTLGIGAYRWSVVYATTGTINTSDQREKNWLGSLADHPQREAYLAAARDIEGALGFYQWNDAVEAKGEDARWHFGAQAQRVIEIFMAHELEAKQPLDLPANKAVPQANRPVFRHAFLCFDTWEEERAPVIKTVKRKIGKGKDAQTVDELVPTGKTRLVREAGNRFGFRIDQLLAFLVAANALMRGDLEGRLAALEAKLLGDAA